MKISEIDCARYISMVFHSSDISYQGGYQGLFLEMEISGIFNYFENF